MTRTKMVEQTREAMADRAGVLSARRFQVAVLLAALGFGVLALLARMIWYFQLDLQLTRTVQGASSPWLDA